MKNVNAKRYSPTPYDLERQLELLAPPSTPPMVRVPLLGADDPVPGSRRTDAGTGGTGEHLVCGLAGTLSVRGVVVDLRARAPLEGSRRVVRVAGTRPRPLTSAMPLPWVDRVARDLVRKGPRAVGLAERTHDERIAILRAAVQLVVAIDRWRRRRRR